MRLFPSLTGMGTPRRFLPPLLLVLLSAAACRGVDLSHSQGDALLSQHLSCESRLDYRSLHERGSTGVDTCLGQLAKSFPQGRHSTAIKAALINGYDAWSVSWALSNYSASIWSLYLFDEAKEWFLSLGREHGVNPIVFGSIYVGAIPFFSLSIGWLIRNLRRRRSPVAPALCASFCFVSAYLYLLIAGENIPAWVYLFLAGMVGFGVYSTVRKIKAKLNEGGRA
jgi:hypothetical protein